MSKWTGKRIRAIKRSGSRTSHFNMNKYKITFVGDGHEIETSVMAKNESCAISMLYMDYDTVNVIEIKEI